MEFEEEEEEEEMEISGGVRYRECLKNHAVSIGGHALDGCGDFMPSAPQSLNCAACGCHRNFHRKETHPNANADADAALLHRSPPYYLRPPAEEDDASNPSSSGGGGTPRKRFRTKFTVEQKEKMFLFAERLGWRIHRHDDAVVEQFCVDTGVNRNVLKIWMHNNKNTLRSKP